MTRSEIVEIDAAKNSKRRRKKEVTIEEEEESTDSNYIPSDEFSSEEDDEASEIVRNYETYRGRMKLGQLADIDDDVMFEGAQFGEVTEHAGYPPEESSEFEDSFEDVGSDGNLMKKQSKHLRFRDRDNEMPQFSLGMKFASKDEFKQAIISYGLASRKLIRFVKDDTKRVRAKCDWNLCPWICLLACTSRTTSWQITSFNDLHVCPPRRDNKLVTSRRIADKYDNLIRANPTWKISAMQAHIQEEMFANVSIDMVKRAKKLVMQKWLDATKGQYSVIFGYQLELIRSNPGSTVVVKLEPDCYPAIFQRVYVCLDALKKGFLAGCRRVVGLDGCFFKGATNGELLCAVGRDANNQIYPIAWAVVEKENNDSWDWFIQLLCGDLRVYDGDGWVFISDQQKGIINAVQHWAPLAEHRNCARHIYANWRKRYKKKEWQKLFWNRAKAPCIPLFNLARAKLAQQTREGASHMMTTDPHHWSRAWLKLGSNCDSVDNNMCESFNKWIVDARFLPIISMLDAIRRKVMVRIQENRSRSDRWCGLICPNIARKLHTYTAASGNCHSISNGNNCYEVKQFDNRYTVNLVEKTCSCRYWQISGIPCAHAIVCIHHVTNDLQPYVASCYSVAAYRETYEHYLMPVGGMTSWSKSNRKPPGPPRYVKLPGRPRKERKREDHEKPKATKLSKVGMVIRCRICKSTGHNRLTCPQNPERQNQSGGTNTNQSSQSNAGPSVQAAQSQGTNTDRDSQSNASPPERVASQSHEPYFQESQRSSADSQSANTNTSTRGPIMLKSSAQARLKTGLGGSASTKLKVVAVNAEATCTVTVGQNSEATTNISVNERATKKRKLPLLCTEESN